MGFGERELERRGGGERALLASGVVSWYGAKSILARWSDIGLIGRYEDCVVLEAADRAARRSRRCRKRGEWLCRPP